VQSCKSSSGHPRISHKSLFWWDHVLALLGTGLRFGEFAGLRRRRVHLERTPPVLQVVDVRYQAGRFGSGFKPRPKSDAGIREVPLAPLVVEAIRSQLPPGADPDALVFAGPGGGNHVPAGSRTVLSRHGIRRMYQTAVKRADLDHLQLRGPHDFRHTFSTWLEDAGIPARVIDELMGLQRSRHGDLDGGSRIGARYRHTTDTMVLRVVDAIQERLTIAHEWPRTHQPTGRQLGGCSRQPPVRTFCTKFKAARRAGERHQRDAPTGINGRPRSVITANGLCSSSTDYGSVHRL
jgi:hypothetical protein